MLKKFTGPGLFRLILALAVFVHHATKLSLGTFAVLVFFTLSGYWIYKMYTGRYAATRQPYLTYIVSRAWRLLPTFLLVTLLSLVVLEFKGTLASIWNADNGIHFLLSNLVILGYEKLPKQPLVPAWSLDIEMQFYLVAPLIALLFLQRKVRASWILIAAAAISAVSAYFHNPISVVSYLVFFVIGMTAAATDWKPTRWLALASLFGTSIAVMVCIACPLRSILLLGAHHGPLSIWNPYANILLALTMAPYAIYTTGQKGFSRDAMFADLSYIVYLLHYSGIVWLRQRNLTMVHRVVASAGVFLVVIGLSYVIWRFYDHPINKMRGRWVNKRRVVDRSSAMHQGLAPAAEAPRNG